MQQFRHLQFKDILAHISKCFLLMTIIALYLSDKQTYNENLSDEFMSLQVRIQLV